MGRLKKHRPCSIWVSLTIQEFGLLQRTAEKAGLDPSEVMVQGLKMYQMMRSGSRKDITKLNEILDLD